MPFPSLADVGFLGLIPLAIAGMLAFPSAPRSVPSQARTILDGLIIAGAVFFVSWRLVLGPTYRQGTGSTLEKAIGLAYPIGDVAILSIVLFIALRAARGHRGALAFIGGGLGVLALADSGFIYQNLHNTYASGSLIDPLWEVGFLLMMLGGVVAISHDDASNDDRDPHVVGLAFPYVAVVLVVVLAAIWRAQAPLESVLFWTMLAVLLFVVARQLLTMLDNVTLTRTLESRVRELVARDISERERVQREREELQTQLNHARRLESLGHMAGAVSHDFNNILGVILGFASHTKAELPDRLATVSREDRKAIEDSFDQIERASRRAANLTRQLLTFSRREPSQPRVIDLNATIRGIEEVLRRTVDQTVDLHLRLAPEVMPIKADPAQIEQALTNLAANARDAMPRGGTLSLETSAVIVDDAGARPRPGLTAGRYVRLIVADTGRGMSEEVAARAFEPFFTTKAKGAGTGLGLATAYGIVTQAGGRIALGSVPGEGSTFTIHLPWSEERVSEEPALEVVRDTPRGREKILVVEDDASMLEIVSLTLSSNGYDVVRARDGAEGIAAVGREGEIDAVVSDVLMPQVSGPELVVHLRRTRPGLPAVLMSGYAEPVVDVADIGEGVRLLGKPFTSHELLAVVREVLSAASEAGTRLAGA